MSATAALKSQTATPSFSDLKQATEALLPLVEAEADEAERIYHQTDKVVSEMRKAGLYRMLTPKAAGGVELPYVEGMQLVERVAHADGSAGWCLMVAGVMGASAGSYLPDGGAKKVYPHGDVTMAGNGVPRGFARPVDGGYMIKGHWAYGSGIYHAEWVHSGCFVMDGDKMRMTAEGAPEIMLCHHPKSTIELKGNWDVLGLRGTGSYDYITKDAELFVPAENCYGFDAKAPMRGGPQYSAGLVAFTTWGHTSWALGIGRRVLDELAKHARDRPADVFGKIADSASFRKSFAEAEAKYRAARAFVYSAWDDMSENFAQGKPATLEQLALIRMAMRHLHDVLSEISTFAHKASRGASLRSSVLQRCYRDIHSGTQHILLADEIVQECGKVMLGVAGGNAYMTMFGVKG